MRTTLAIVALVVGVGLAPAKADGITDLDGWTKSFAAAAGRTDTESMTALIRQVAIKSVQMELIEKDNFNIQKYFGGHQLLYVEQFENKHLGNFRYRINFAVRYLDAAIYYSVAFVRLQNGLELYGYNTSADVNQILKLEW